jgi:hypothetical protein
MTSLIESSRMRCSMSFRNGRIISNLFMTFIPRRVRTDSKSQDRQALELHNSAPAQQLLAQSERANPRAATRSPHRVTRGSVADTSAGPDMAHFVGRPIPCPLLDRHYTQIILNTPGRRRPFKLFEIQKGHHVQQPESVVKNRSSNEDFLTVSLLCRKHLAYIRSPGGKSARPTRRIDRFAH